ncbi:MAG: polysaccharide biosynthesis/export family protein [Bacteroidales bacterium]|nr:polysaccharide biosynthesis/export family protein [Bacteroidales bacterium]
MNRKLCLFAAIIGLILVSSCTSRKNLVYINDHPKGDTIVNFNQNDLSVILQPGDVVYIKVLSLDKVTSSLFNLDMTGSSATGEVSTTLRGYTLDEHGYIRLPVVDTIQVAGLSISEAEQLVQQRIDGYFKNATVILKLLNTKISVLGEVNKPGTYSILRNSINLFEALALAGDITQFGDRKSVLIIRTIDNKNITFRVDLTKENILATQQFYLLPNDIVIVEPLPLRAFRLNSQTISLVFSGLTTLVTTLTFFYSVLK